MPKSVREVLDSLLSGDGVKIHWARKKPAQGEDYADR